MKNKFLLFLVLAVTSMNVSAQKEKSMQAPAAAKTAFEKAFPEATKSKWGKEKTDFEVEFVLHGKHMAAVYEGNGTLKETEEDIKIAALPKTVADYIAQHYPKATVKEAAKITKPGGEINYEAEVNKKDLIFDANGKFIREEKDED